uniref:Carbohydrate sulfotransferase 1-like n=1 Tax=Saccoglossus kowalevskii TaxID=10224 RepID=A0ABM0GML5_SACKO|nr:PREDICTED: carbohydrate sulfotransferase 1-like [Saccoglossus kowalevskii]
MPRESTFRLSRNHSCVLLVLLLTNVVFVMVIYTRYDAGHRAAVERSRAIFSGHTAGFAAGDPDIVNAILDVRERLGEIKNLTRKQSEHFDKMVNALQGKQQRRESSLLNELPRENGSTRYSLPVLQTTGTNVLVSASMRTGSSFVGELLNQNPDSLYIFEPLKSLKLKDSDPYLPLFGADMLAAFYRCNFSAPSLKRFLDDFNSESVMTKRNHVREWVGWRYCSGWNTADKTYENCKPFTPAIASESCTKHTIKAAKIIRINDLSNLIHLMKDPEIDLKVINVIRDPRGKISSVLPIHLNGYRTISRMESNKIFTVEHLNAHPELSEILQRYCTETLRNILLARHASWFPKRNYQVIRYEDAAYEPKKTAEIIYKFLGLNFHGDVLKWVDENTRQENIQDPNFVYSTRRDSRMTAENWRRKLTLELAKSIENTGECGKLMDTLGYALLEAIMMIKDDPNVSCLSWITLERMRIFGMRLNGDLIRRALVLSSLNYTLLHDIHDLMSQAVLSIMLTEDGVSEYEKAR